MASTPKGCDPVDPEDPNDPLDQIEPEPGLNATQQAQVAQMILESMPGWGTDGLFLVWIYASWWWLLETPEESPGMEVAGGTPFWRNVIQQQGGPVPPEVQVKANALGSQRIIKKRPVFRDGKLGWEIHELNRQEDGSWL